MINYYDKQTDIAATEVSSELQCTDAFFCSKSAFKLTILRYAAG
jgi:hypothetical protein